MAAGQSQVSPRSHELISRRDAAGPVRDARIDFFRGLALLFIFVDHVPDNALQALTLQSFGFADAADVFVVLAGYASFLAYSRVFDEDGWGAGLVRLVRRMRELYLWHVLMMAVCIGVLAMAAQRLENPIYEELVDFGPFVEDPARALRQALTLVLQPGYMDILPLYIVLLIWFPVLLLLARVHVAVALAASALLWAGANLLHWNLPNYSDGEGWFFNPFAWQLLFSLGVVTAHLTAKTGNLLPRWRWPLWVAMGFVLFAFVVAAPWTVLPVLEDASLIPSDLFVSPTSKQNLALWRVAHIAALAYIAAALIPARASWLAGPLAQRVVDCGRHSLQVFCLGIVLSLAGSVVMAELGAGWASQVGVNAVGIALLGLAGWTLAEMKRARAASGSEHSDRYARSTLAA